MNPQLIKEQAVQDAINIAGQNFVEIFKRIDANRFALSASSGFGRTLSGYGRLRVSDIDVQLQVTGRAPVLVGLTTVCDVVTTAGVSGITAGGLSLSDAGSNSVAGFYPELSANGAYFWSTFLGGLTPVTGVAVWGYVNATGGIVAGAGTGDFSVTHSVTGAYQIDYNTAFDSPPSVQAVATSDKKVVTLNAPIQAGTLGIYGWDMSLVVASDTGFSFRAVGPKTGGTSNFKQYYSPSTVLGVHQPSGPGVVTYSFSVATSSTFASSSVVVGIDNVRLFAAELF